MNNETKPIGLSRSPETDADSVRILPTLFPFIERGEAPQLPDGALASHPDSYQVGDDVIPWSYGAADALQALYGSAQEYTADTIHAVFSWLNDISSGNFDEAIEATRALVNFANTIYYAEAIDLFYDIFGKSVNHENVYRFATGLIEDAADTEILKLGLFLMRYYIGNYQMQIPQLHALAVTEEFSHFAISLMVLARENGNEDTYHRFNELIYTVARETTGWGHTLAMRSLKPTSGEIKAYLASDGEVEKSSFRHITDENALLCSVIFASWMKEQYQKDVTSPADNLDMILRYCGPWSEAFFEEKNRQVHDFYYSIRMEDDMVYMEPSYPLTCLYASDPVDFSDSPAYPGFESQMPLLTTSACFPGKQQSLDAQYSTWTLRFLLDEIEHIANCAKQNPDFVDHYSRDEFVRAAAPGFIDNQLPYSAGPSCADRVISFATYRNVLAHMVKDFSHLRAAAGIEVLYEGLFDIALCASWYQMIYAHGIRTALSFRTSFDRIVEEAQYLYDKEVREHKQEQLPLEDYTDIINRIEQLLTTVVIDPSDEEYERLVTDDAIGAALKNRERALWDYMSPQERVKRGI